MFIFPHLKFDVMYVCIMRFRALYNATYQLYMHILHYELQINIDTQAHNIWIYGSCHFGSKNGILCDNPRELINIIE